MIIVRERRRKDLRKEIINNGEEMDQQEFNKIMEHSRQLNELINELFAMPEKELTDYQWNLKARIQSGEELKISYRDKEKINGGNNNGKKNTKHTQ